MKTSYYFFVFCFVLLSGNAQTQVTYKDVIDEISKTRIEQTVETLEGFGTRFMLTPKRFEAANWIKNEFELMGYTDVKLDSFQCHTVIGPPYISRNIDTVTTQVNVVATLEGNVKPEDIHIICGHYDSFCDNANVFNTAPGADDNASGTTAVLETARAVKESGYIPGSTLKFIAFAAEELMYFGDSGAEHYAAAAAVRGENIKLVVNNDMIGYNNKSNLFFDHFYMSHPSSFGRINKALDIVNDVTSLTVLTDGYYGADLAPFLSKGYTGIYFEEATFNNANYHKSSDNCDKLDFAFMTEVIKSSCAVFIGLDENITDVIEDQKLTNDFVLYQNYPNPFNPSTTIKFTIGTSPSVPLLTKERDERVRLEVYNTLGQKIGTLVNNIVSPGTYEMTFDGSDLSSGVYLYRLTYGNYSITKSMLLMK